MANSYYDAVQPARFPEVWKISEFSQPLSRLLCRTRSRLATAGDVQLRFRVTREGARRRPACGASLPGGGGPGDRQAVGCVGCTDAPARAEAPPRMLPAGRSAIHK